MSDENTTISEADLTRLLPTCQRCRRLRRKCDTQLPACRLCQKGKADCMFFDHALQQTLPRSYVHSLISRLSRLKSVQAVVEGNGEVIAGYGAPEQGRVSLINANQFEQPFNHWGTYTSQLSLDKHFVVQNSNPTCWQFLGSSSPYALAVEVLVHAQVKHGKITHQEDYSGPDYWFNAQGPENPEASKPRQTPLRSEVEMLVDLYMATTNVLMVFFEPEQTHREIDTYLRHHGSDVRYLTGKEAHEFFRVSLICAIAAANKARHKSAYLAESVAYYTEGLQCVEEVTSDVSVDDLQALLLLILFTTFFPRKGDIWKLLDLACRLSVELNYHTEPNDDYEDEKSRSKRRSIFWGLYCIERTFGQHLGRPSDLTEDIMTVDYPATLNLLSLPDPDTYQALLTSHYFRLTYLRSEIFRELYLPAVAPNLPTMWYETRLDNILSWRKELDHFESITGMGSMTCEMGFDTSVCFLFQPLLLRALVATKDPVLPPDVPELIPRESYHAACKVVEFYNKVFRGSEHTPFGMYPVTLISAHYIHQATLTIMAHCLLAIDGRLPVVTFSSELSKGTQGPIDFHGIHEIAGTCLILLGTLARRWPGMVGIQDIFKNLQDKVLPIMMRSGLG